jgi:hypothetical protein
VSRADALPNGRATAPIYPPTPLHCAAATRGYIAMCELGSLQSDWPVKPSARASFVLRSSGPDGKPNTSDDITVTPGSR